MLIVLVVTLHLHWLSWGRRATSWCCHQTLHTTKITIQSCSCRSSCIYLMACWFPKRQIAIPLPASSFFLLLSLSLLLLATWSHHLPCSISFAPQNLPPFLLAHSPSRKSLPFKGCISFLPGWQTESAVRGAWGGLVCMASGRSACLGAGGEEKEKESRSRTSPCWWLWTGWLIGSSRHVEAQNIRAVYRMQ